MQLCFKKYELKNLITSLTALKLITGQKGTIIKSKTTNVFLKVRKGHPVGCKVVLKHTKMNQFLEKLINDFTILSKDANLNRMHNSLFSFNLKNILNFVELEKNYQFFNRLDSPLNINISMNVSNYEQSIFLLKSYKIKILKSKCNSIGRV